MAVLTSQKIALALMENAIETFESQQGFLPYVELIDGVSAAGLQNSNNVAWRPVQQHAPDISGWDVTGLETGIIQESYPAYLGTPSNDIIELRVDDVRDISYWNKRGKEAGRKRASVLNTAIINSIKNTGSIAYRANPTSGFDFVAQAQASLNKRQVNEADRYFALTDTQNFLFGKDLASRQTLQPGNQPNSTFQDGMLYKNIAGFNILKSSSTPSLVGGADPATTVTANVSFAPTAGSVNTTTNTVTNVDYRTGTIAVTASASYNVGDRVTFANSAVTVKAVGLDDKAVSDEAMTFVIVSKPSGTSIEVWPKPIAADDPALSTLEKSYANINTRILNTATVNRINIDATTQPGLFWQKGSIEVLTGEVPMQMIGQFGGMKVAAEKIGNTGLTMYLLYDGNIKTAAVSWRMFAWYGVNNAAPSQNGIAIKY
jgi:hypothetical protein